MNKILDKLGIYDLVAVLLSGISICTFSLLVLQLVYNFHINIELYVNETFSFLVISYFLGLIFQECGSLILKIIYENNKLLKKALKVSNNSHILLTKIEKDRIYDYVKSELDIKYYNDNIVYNYCKFYVIKNYDTSRIDKYQSLSAMSRSLSLYFAILAIFTLINVFMDPTYFNIILVFVSVIFSVLLFFRCIRLAKLRYIYIFRIFYYNVLEKNYKV